MGRFYFRVNKYFIPSAPSKSSMLSVLFYLLGFLLADVSCLGALSENGRRRHRKWASFPHCLYD